MSLLDSAARSQPATHWWIKGDGCDLLAGLTESVRLKWSGDQDLDDGKLHKEYEAYLKRLDMIEKIGTGGRDDQLSIILDLKECLRVILLDKEFLVTSMLNVYNSL